MEILLLWEGGTLEAAVTDEAVARLWSDSSPLRGYTRKGLDGGEAVATVARERGFIEPEPDGDGFWFHEKTGPVHAEDLPGVLAQTSESERP